MSISKNFYLQSISAAFLSNGLLTEEQISIITKAQRTNKILFGQLAVNLGFLKEDDLLNHLSEIYFIEPVSLEFLYISNEVLTSLSNDISIFSLAIPFYKDNEVVKIAISDPGNLKAIDMIVSHFKNLETKFYIAKESEILRFIEIIKNKTYDVKKNPLLLLNKIIFDSIEKQVSDIHFEPHNNFINVRIRINGILENYTKINYELWNRIKSRLKIISNLDIAETRKPQSGHARINMAGKTIDMRISIHPDQFGEAIAVRLFDLSNDVKALNELGFQEDDIDWLRNAISHPNGIFLIVGPTGSGKTTTFYSLLKEIKSPNINIMTLEDPIEYQIDGIKQLELRENGLISFADGVRSILRQDPDVMLIGEIRDEETAASAIRAALTGRLVFATLHASTPINALRRLINLGIPLCDIIPLLIGIFSQRLVRSVECEESAKEHRFPIVEYMSFTDEMKKKLTKTGDIGICKLNKTFKSSSKSAINNKLTNFNEIKRVLGDVSL
jgi:type II secretory ATPase GspE/PulE/Tfp pilus assembly ATPase PilB-like protein